MHYTTEDCAVAEQRGARGEGEVEGVSIRDTRTATGSERPSLEAFEAKKRTA
jgi:hypothetical protein